LIRAQESSAVFFDPDTLHAFKQLNRALVVSKGEGATPWVVHVHGLLLPPMITHMATLDEASAISFQAELIINHSHHHSCHNVNSERPSSRDSVVTGT
jgi:hypothetical protein